MTHDQPTAPVVPAPVWVARSATAARTLVRAGRPSIARVLTAGPVLGASALAVGVTVARGIVRRLTGAERPVRPEVVSRDPFSGGAGVRVTWTSVEIRWTAP